jgi:TrmH family RNA methyltransferase
MISKNHVKHIQQLHSKKYREENALFIIEGIKIVTEFLNSDQYKITEVLALAEFISVNKNIMLEKNILFTEINDEELKKISAQQSPNQVLAIVQSPSHNSNPINPQEELCLFLDDIRDPGNLGTIIRIADWFGVKHVFCSQHCTELYNPKTLQATMGAVLRVQVTYTTFDDLFATNKNTPIYGAILNGENIYTKKLTKGILVIGNEANGISDAVLRHITTPITIPSATINGSESLNAANACAIICSEFHRQLNYN